MSIFALGRLAFAATISHEAVIEQLGKMGAKLILSSRKVDDDTGERLVEAMQADSPNLTDHLDEGITARREGDVTIVEASAIKGDWDYAPFVEHGTSHMAAEPYFYDNVDEVLGERADRMSDVAGSL